MPAAPKTPVKSKPRKRNRDPVKERQWQINRKARPGAAVFVRLSDGQAARLDAKSALHETRQAALIRLAGLLSEK
jgi:hypothetical protein